MLNNLISISEVNKNFSAVAKKCDELGEVIVLKNNLPVYVISSLSEENQKMEITNDDIIDIASKRVLKKYHKAFEELAK